MIRQNIDNPWIFVALFYNESLKASICIAPIATKIFKPNKISYSALIFVKKYFKWHEASQNNAIWRYMNNTDTLAIATN